MVTNQIMESQDRLLDGVIIRQRTKDEFFAISDVVLLCDRWCYENNKPRFDINQYFRLEASKKFIEALKKKKNCEVVYKGKKGNTGWIHPHLFLDLILWINPEFKVTIYDWLFDYLISSRTQSGDSYRIMCGVLYEFCSNKKRFKSDITNLCRIIKKMILCDENAEWNKASKEQLKARDDVQMMIADLTATLRDSKQGVRLGIAAYEQRKLHIKRRDDI